MANFIRKIINKLLLRSAILETVSGVRGMRKTSARMASLIATSSEFLGSKADANRALLEALLDAQDSSDSETIKYFTSFDRRLSKIEKSIASNSLNLDELIKHRLLLLGLQDSLSMVAETTRHADNMPEQWEAQVKTLINDAADKIIERMKAISVNEFRQRECLDQINHAVKLDPPLPPTRRAAGSPDFLMHLYQTVRTKKPNVVVELGSGVSTVIVAAALRDNGGGRVISLDHLPQYHSQTTSDLAARDLASYGTVKLTPLEKWVPPAPTSLGKEWQWYGSPDDLTGGERIDLLIVDGPPQGRGASKFARYPALPHFHDRLADDAIVLLDDASRPEEHKIALKWSREFGFTSVFQTTFDKGFATLKRGKSD